MMSPTARCRRCRSSNTRRSPVETNTLAAILKNYEQATLDRVLPAALLLEWKRALLAKGSLGGVIFETDDVDATFERIRAAGAEVMQEPIDQPYGVRDCAFRDPSGNMLRFSSPQKR